jgi:hypothetical protein
MDETTRQVINTIYVAFGTAAGIGVLNEANEIITGAVADGSVRDPAARLALRHLVANCGNADTQAQIGDAMGFLLDSADTAAANLSGSAGALAVATGDESIARITAHITRRVGRITAATPLEEVKAILGMVEALEGAVDRIKTAHRVNA